jgi:NAD(P)-dependent dehydrogenase (short-subunit alcohol dehydrogenase family)
VYVVFGATGGIGSQLVVQLLAQPGARVVAAVRDEAKAINLSQGIDSHGRLSHSVYDCMSSKSVRVSCPIAASLRHCATTKRDSWLFTCPINALVLASRGRYASLNGVTKELLHLLHYQNVYG